MLEMFGPNVFIRCCISPLLCSGTVAHSPLLAASVSLPFSKMELEKAVSVSEKAGRFLPESLRSMESGVGVLIQFPTLLNAESHQQVCP